jgi:hypothetical protein
LYCGQVCQYRLTTTETVSIYFLPIHEAAAVARGQLSEQEQVLKYLATLYFYAIRVPITNWFVIGLKVDTDLP